MTDATRFTFRFDQAAAETLGPEKMAAMEGRIIPVTWKEGQIERSGEGLIEKVDQSGPHTEVTMVVPEGLGDLSFPDIPVSVYERMPPGTAGLIAPDYEDKLQAVRVETGQPERQEGEHPGAP